MATCSITDSFTVTGRKASRDFVKAMDSASRSPVRRNRVVSRSLSGRDEIRGFFSGRGAEK